MSIILAVKPGNSCKEYALFTNGHLDCKWTIEQRDLTCTLCCEVRGVAAKRETIAIEKCSALFSRIAHDIRERCDTQNVKLEKIAIKVSVPGSGLQQHQLVHDTFLQALEANRAVAPFTVPAVVREVQTLQHHFSHIPLVAVSDTLFYKNVTAEVGRYSFPQSIVDTYDIRRFGYDGIVTNTATKNLTTLVGQSPARVVVCHVGETISVSAIKNGICVDTSGGFSQASGMAAASRGGDIDAAALLALQRVAKLSIEDTSVLLHTRCGLRGLTGEEGMSSLLAQTNVNEPQAVVGLQQVVKQLQKQIGAMAAVTNGVDAIVFTGTTAVHSSELREKVARSLTYLGVRLSGERNDSAIGAASIISTRASRVMVTVIKVDELRELALVADEHPV